MISSARLLLVRSAVPAAAVVPQRGMATLKEVKNRIKSVKNIQKITKSMKMVAAAKLRQVQVALEPTRPLYAGVKTVFPAPEKDLGQSQLLVSCASDKGLCGAFNSSIIKGSRAAIIGFKKDDKKVQLLPIGEKVRQALQRESSELFVMSVSELSKKPPTFVDAARIAETIVATPYNTLHLLFNEFKSVIAFETTTRQLPSFDAIDQGKISEIYDFKAEELRDFYEFTVATTLFNCLLENATTEMSQRMSSMDNATRNASDMIDKMTLKYNRARQAVITTELIEIISGANALEK
eukprot:TRINITY_DN17670_c0_g1_i1.p1 TRINITY_DN17670_c0_g1~~TRINITY_DN17670_c0_g1_i1.p1  ORF type:complete len:308 (-),score=101.51 TRINITY_DN17670_c0_g1_i1:23-904(-)